MDQRPLRLGDIVDDYCPRERRITNHAVVALIGDQIRQTRCTTCDGEHVYKQGKMPKRGTGKDAGGDATLSENGHGQLVPKVASPKEEASLAAQDAQATPAETSGDTPAPDRPSQDGPEPPRDVDGWLAHRPLIRATLPRTDGEPPAPRPIPEFTMHRQAYGRNFRGQGRYGAGQASNGNGFDHDRQPNGNHNHGNPGNGQPRPGGGGGRRRRRRGGRHKQSH